MTSVTDFQCRRCGNCCRWPGPVRVNEKEIEAIAGFLNLDFNDFIQHYTRLTADRRSLSLLEKPDGSCLYLDESGAIPACGIEKVKPKQCRNFPEKWNFPGWENECEGAK